MKMLRWLRLFITMSSRRKSLLVRALIYSLWIELKIMLLGNNHMLRGVLINKPNGDLTIEQRKQVYDVKKIVSIISKRAPWNPMCLNLALVGRRLLNEYGIKSEFHLGWLENQPRDKMLGHAWLTLDKLLITGWLPNLNDYIEMAPPTSHASKAS